MEPSRELPNQRRHDIVGERMADVVVASQQRRRGRLSNPRLEGDLPVLREQRIGDDVPAQQIVHGHEPVRFRSKACGAGSPSAPAHARGSGPMGVASPEFAAARRSSMERASRLPQLVGDGRDRCVTSCAKNRCVRGANSTTRTPTCSRYRSKAQSETRASRRRRRPSAASDSSPRRRAEGQRVPQETGQRGVCCVDLPVAEVLTDCVDRSRPHSP